MVPVSIASARPADVPAILGLIRALADYEKLSGMVVATEADLHEALFGRRPVAECLVARDATRAIGFALYFHNYSTFLGRPGLYLEDLFVIPECRGRGTGRALLRRLAALAVERRCGRLEWSVLDWNAPSIAFYENLGARHMSEWRLYRLTGDSLQALAGEDG